MSGDASDRELRRMRGKISEFGLADPNDVEHQLTLLDNIGGFEPLKIRASFCYSACNKRTPRFFVSTVHRKSMNRAAKR